MSTTDFYNPHVLASFALDKKGLGPSAFVLSLDQEGFAVWSCSPKIAQSTDTLSVT